jgi:hypothetical protein
VKPLWKLIVIAFFGRGFLRPILRLPMTKEILEKMTVEERGLFCSVTRPIK